MAAELERRALAGSSAPQPGYWTEVLNGDWRALRQAVEPVGSAGSDRPRASGLAHATAAVLAALRGETAEARARAAVAEGDPWGGAEVGTGVCLARAITELALGRPSDSFEHIRDHLDSSRTAAPAGKDLVGVLAQVAVDARQLEYARRALDACGATSSREGLLARAILAPYDAPLLEAARPGRGHPPFLLGRLHLALGMRMRRTHRVRESRAHLEACVDLLSPLAAAPWLDLARHELRAAGVPQPFETSPRSLTLQEAAIARLAADGLSNRDIGELLHVSPRTVGSHLYKVFPKLGITRRQQLAASLAHGG